MRPLLGDGDRALLRPSPEGPLLPGALVLVDLGERGLALHRVLAARPGEVLVKGDANPRPDGWVARSTVLARAVRLRRGGRWADLDAPLQLWLGRAAAWASPHSSLLARLTRPLRRLARARSRAGR